MNNLQTKIYLEYLLVLLHPTMFWLKTPLHDLVLEQDLRAPELSVGSQVHDSSSKEDSLHLAGLRNNLRQYQSRILIIL